MSHTEKKYQLLLYHSHSNRNITVHVMEGTTIFVNSVIYIANMSHVQIESYSQKNGEQGLARMVGLINSTKAIPPAMPTRFNILNNKNFRYDDLIFDNIGFNIDDKTHLMIANALFKPFHAGLMLKNFRVVTDYDDPSSPHAIFEPYRVDSRVVGMIDCDLRVQGSVLRAFTTVFNFHMENVKIETQHLYRFSLARTTCGESGTSLDTRMFFKNVTSFISGNKPSYLHVGESFIRNNVANDVVIEDTTFDTYVGYSQDIGQVVFLLAPQDCHSQQSNKWNFTNFHMTTSRFEEGKNIEFDKSNVLGIVRSPPLDIPLEMHITNLTFSNDDNNIFGNLVGWFNPNTSYHVNGLRFVNSDGILMNLRSIKSLNLKNLVYEN